MAEPRDAADATFEALFENAYDPQYIRSLDGTRFFRVNRAFEALVGYPRAALEGGKVSPEALIHPDARESYGKTRLEWNERDEARYDLKVLTGTGETRDVEFAVRRTLFNGVPAVLGSARDVTERRRLEAQLKEEIAIQRRKTIEAAKASVRIWQLTEKIRRVPDLATGLLDTPDAAALLRKAGEFLTDPEGLNYGEIQMFLIEEGALVRRYPPEGKGKRRYGLDKDTPYARVARGEGELVPAPGEVILPLRGRDRILGVMAVTFDADERILFDESQTVRSGQLDIVRTLANSLALQIENLTLLETVRRQTIQDALTGVFNRRYLDDKLRDEVRRARRYRRPLSLLMVDLDHFKEINDSLGHPQGDQTLKDIARLLKAQSRDIDLVCRYGGDEFTMVLPETDAVRALRKAERLRERVEETAFTNVADAGRPLKFTMSVGVASLADDVTDEADLLKRADEALYQSKRDGRNRVTAR